MKRVGAFLLRHFDTVRGSVIVVVAVGFSIVVGVAVHATQTSAERDQARAAARAQHNLAVASSAAEVALRAAFVEQCQRQNVKQAEDNRNQAADFTFDRIFLSLVQATPRKRQTRRQREQLAEFLGPLRGALRAKAWVPLVPDCSQAAAGYVAPVAVPFFVRLPPLAALQVP